MKRRLRPLQSFRYYGSHRRAIALTAFLAVVAGLAEALGIVLVVPLADIVASEGDNRFTGSLGPVHIDATATQLAVLAGALLLVSTIASVLSAIQRARTVTSWERSERERVVRAYLGADYSFETGMRSGTLPEMASQHVARASDGVVAVAVGVNAGFNLAMLGLTAVAVNPVAALSLTLLGGVLLALLRPMAVANRKASATAGKYNVATTNLVSEIVGVTRDIKLFAAASAFLDRFRQLNAQVWRARRRSMAFSGSAPALYQGFGLLLLVGALGVASTRSSLDLPSFGATAVLLLRSISYGQRLNTAQQRLVESVPYAERLDAEIRMLEVQAERFGERAIDHLDEVRFDHVHYSYDGEVPALTGIDLRLERPGIVGLAGPSGSGKSTLAQIMLRLRQATSGRVLVDGIPIDEFDPHAWSRVVALVPQEPELLHATVLDNIAFYRPWVTEEAVVEASRAVGLHDLFASMPDGYRSEIGASIHDLSGGQRQRVGIARALVGHPSLLVMDEPTSALDTESERWVHAALDGIRDRALIVVIAHRESTLAICDSVLMLADGALVSADLGA